MQQIQCTRCGYTLAGTPGSMAICPNCGQQTMISGGSGQGWNASPGGQQPGGQQPGGYRSPSSGSPYGGPTQEQPSYGSGPTYGQPAPPYPTPQEQYGGQGGAFGPTAPGGYQGGYPGGYQTPPTPARRNPILPIALVVALLLVAGGAFLFINKNHNNGAAKTPTATATIGATATPTAPSLPAGYTQYTDSNGFYTLGYPSDWTKEGQNTSGIGLAVFGNNDGSAVFEVEELPASGLSNSDLSSLMGDFFKGFAGSYGSGNGTLANQSSPQSVTIAGQSWTQESADINSTDSSGNPVTAHLEASVISHNNHIIVLAELTPNASDFATAKEQFFTPMIGTFAFK